MPTDPSEAWKHLGRLLIERRVRLDPAYRNRRRFCADNELNYKLVQDVEKHTRRNFGPQILAAFEVAYRWRPGSIQRVIDGGEPMPVELFPDIVTRPEDVRLQPAPAGYPKWVGDDPFLRHIWDFPEASEQERCFAGHAVLLSRSARGEGRDAPPPRPVQG